jgi:hypothetical protein
LRTAVATALSAESMAAVAHDHGAACAPLPVAHIRFGSWHGRARARVTVSARAGGTYTLLLLSGRFMKHFACFPATHPKENEVPPRRVGARGSGRGAGLDLDPCNEVVPKVVGDERVAKPTPPRQLRAAVATHSRRNEPLMRTGFRLSCACHATVGGSGPSGRCACCSAHA